MPRQIIVKRHLTDQITDELAAVRRIVQSKMAAGSRVEPVDLVGAVEHDDPVGNCLCGVLETLQHCGELVGAAFLAP